eukprot:765787-Hanusia_phi.AAC.2
MREMRGMYEGLVRHGAMVDGAGGGGDGDGSGREVRGGGEQTTRSGEERDVGGEGCTGEERGDRILRAR